jgi:hypothetical protein
MVLKSFLKPMPLLKPAYRSLRISVLRRKPGSKPAMPA